MSELITSKNLDKVIEKNLIIKDEIIHYKDRLLTDLNLNNVVKAEEKLAFQILKDNGLIQLPIEDKFWGGAIYTKNDRKIPVLNTAQPRVYQYFVAWHEVYHLLYDKDVINNSFNISIDMELNERKAYYFASMIMLGNVYNYYNSLSEDSFINKIIYCMDLYKAPYKAILINLYEVAKNNNNSELIKLILENFDNKPINLVEKFQELELDDELVKPSHVVSIGNLERKIKKAMQDDCEASSHESNLDYLKQLTKHIKELIKE
ncbi:hypothetical protein FC789_15290 [Clostridium botulinum]|nr:hypothetical protein [Clostridium botulinum]